MKFRYLAVALAFSISASMAAGAALAADLPTTKSPPAPPAPPNWWDTLTVNGVIDAGITFNPDLGAGGNNFGRLFDDKANSPLLNQMSLIVQRPLDPNAKGIDFGFKVQLLYGSDARYTHFLGECDYCINEINQFDVVEAWGAVHLPYAFSGGVDVKAGQFVTLEGAEVINAPDNLFYSHSYIFNFGTPLKDTGVMTISHVTPMVDIYAGAVTGVNRSLGWASPAFGDPGNQNNGAAFEGGIGLNLLDGNLTVLATTNIGPENPNTPLGIAACACDPNTTLRYLNDTTVTWKATDKLTFITDANFIHDDGYLPGGVSGYGIAQYASYAIYDWLKINGRAEVWRDNNGFFVAAYPGNFDFVNSEHGYLNGSYGAPGAAAFQGNTYLGLTAGLNITPALPKETPYLKAIIFRPEIRYDASLNDTTPFAAGTKSSQFTVAGDLILKF
ncbi:MAG: outer membrane beta-barrel protein [Beijerinckiaceae bacterium]